MDYIAIYTILLSILLYTAIKRKCNLVIILIVGYYTIVGIMGIVGVRLAGLDEYQSQTTILPYLFLILCYIIHFSPLMRSNSGLYSEKISASAIPQYRILIYTFLVAGVISIALYLQPVLALISGGNWKSNRIILLNGEIVYPYSNIIEYLMLNFANYFSLPAQIVSLVIIAKDKDKKLGWITLAVSASYRVLACLYTSSRGGIFNLIVLLVALFAFFMKDLGKTSKVAFVVLGIIGLGTLLPIMSSITTDRFGSDFAGTSVWRYFGQPAIMFSYGVAPMKRFALGRYAFSSIIDTGYAKLDLGGKWVIGGTWGSTFFTFVGYEYIDWGPVGCILIGAFVAYIMRRIIAKKEYRISDLYLIFVYIQFLINGCLVIGRNYTLQIILSLVIYVILRYILERSKPIPKIVFRVRKDT